MRFNQRQQISFFHLLFHFILLSGTNFVAVYCQSLSRDLPSERLCPRQVVTFTCETRGSPILAWTSDEYIELGGTQLEFATFNNIGDVRRSPVNPNTIATLVNKTVENGVNVLVSTLRIRTLSGFRNSSVNCLHIGNGNVNTSRVQVIVDAAAPQIQDSALWIRNSTRGSCVADLSWSSPINTDAMDILRYEVIFYGQVVANETDDENIGVISAVYIYDEDCDCTNRNEFMIRAVNRCNRTGAPSSAILGPPKLLRALDCDSLTTEPPADVSTAFMSSSYSDSDFYGVVSALVVLVVYSVISTSTFTIVFIMKSGKQKPKQVMNIVEYEAGRSDVPDESKKAPINLTYAGTHSGAPKSQPPPKVSEFN